MTPEFPQNRRISDVSIVLRCISENTEVRSCTSHLQTPDRSDPAAVEAVGVGAEPKRGGWYIHDLVELDELEHIPIEESRESSVAKCIIQ